MRSQAVHAFTCRHVNARTNFGITKPWLQQVLSVKGKGRNAQYHVTYDNGTEVWLFFVRPLPEFFLLGEYFATLCLFDYACRPGVGCGRR